MSMSETPKTAHHPLSDPSGSDLPELQQEADVIAAEYSRAMLRHTTVEHLAGLSEHAIAQELIDHCGPDRVLQAITQVRSEGKDHFFDLICALLPSLWQRRKFCAQLLSRLSDKQHRRETRTADAQKENYLRFCQQCDALPIAAIPGLRALQLRDVRKRFTYASDGSFLAHHHFSSLPRDFDAAQYTEELAASGNRLSRLHEVENERFARTVACIEKLSGDLRSRILAVTGTIRGAVETAWAPRIAAIQNDAASLERATNSLQSPEVQKTMQTTLQSIQRLLKETIAARDCAVKEKNAPYATILHRLPPTPPSVQTDAATKGEKVRNGHGNGKKKNGSTPNGTAVTA
ncbi:MAG: hypothetical protein Q7S29_00255 [Candidatus Peribacter sp.]|nr:hypothetical protein [Candidatus Peribacter sp.]